MVRYTILFCDAVIQIGILAMDRYVSTSVSNIQVYLFLFSVNIKSLAGETFEMCRV